jgi:hypothetical protein
MTGRVALGGLFIGVCLVLAGWAEGGGSSSARKVLRVDGSVILTHMDGPWVAIHVQTPGKRKYETCDSVSFWNVTSGRTVAVQATKAQSCDDTGEAYIVDYLGFAGGRVVWTSHFGGRYPICQVMTATVDAPRAREIPECYEDEETGYGSGEDVGAWAGDGPLLVGNTTWDDPGCDPSCPPSTLVRVGATKLQRLKSGDAIVYVHSVDAGRILVVRDDGDVALLDATGRELFVLPFKPKEVVWTELGGDDLAVKKARRLDVYDARSGKLRKSWSLRAGSRLFDVHAGIAVILRGKLVQLLRLSDGHGAAYAAPGEVTSAEIEEPGLVYAYNAPKAGSKPGRIVFVPLAEVQGRLH